MSEQKDFADLFQVITKFMIPIAFYNKPPALVLKQHKRRG